VLVEPGRPDALVAPIRALLEDPARGRAMGRAGRRRVEAHFRWVCVATRTREVYQDAIADFARSAES
jgi:glycosyltransferase involved in cell wall biosynthesis